MTNWAQSKDLQPFLIGFSRLFDRITIHTMQHCHVYFLLLNWQQFLMNFQWASPCQSVETVELSPQSHYDTQVITNHDGQWS